MSDIPLQLFLKFVKRINVKYLMNNIINSIIDNNIKRVYHMHTIKE